jgi:hypothetical protein
MRLPFMKRASCAVILGAVVVVGCGSSDGSSSSTPTLDASITQIADTICARLKECLTTFATQFPGGTSDCASQVKSSTESAAMSDNRDLTAPAQCTQAVLNTCLSDINAATCTEVNASATLPDSCQMKC